MRLTYSSILLPFYISLFIGFEAETGISLFREMTHIPTITCFIRSDKMPCQFSTRNVHSDLFIILRCLDKCVTKYSVIALKKTFFSEIY